MFSDPAYRRNVKDYTPHDLRLEAEALYGHGELGESEAKFRVLLETPLRHEALYGLAMIALRGGAFERGEAMLEQCLGVSPDHSDALLALARRRIERGDKHAAISLLGRALAAHPGYRPALRLLSAIAADGADIREERDSFALHPP